MLPLPSKLLQLHFEFTRAFDWSAESMEGVRNVMAYGLAVLPEALDIIKADEAGDTETSETRRLSYDQQQFSAPPRSKRFVVKLKQPLPYNIDADVLQLLLRKGAWRGLSDGHEATEGPVRISKVMLATDVEDHIGMSVRIPRQRLALSSIVLVGACVAVATLGIASWLCSRQASLPWNSRKYSIVPDEIE